MRQARFCDLPVFSMVTFTAGPGSADAGDTARQQFAETDPDTGLVGESNAPGLR